MQQKLEKLFSLSKKGFKISDLVKMLSLDIKQTEELRKCLYNLECEGKIHYIGDSVYEHVALETYLYHGEIKKSNKGKYYITCNKKTINISEKDLNGAQEGDFVFVEKESRELKHSKLTEGKVVRIVTEVSCDDINAFYKAVLKKDYNRGYCYVEVLNSMFIIADKDLNGAQEGDIVTVHINNRVNKVVNIIKRSVDNLILECRKEYGKLVWATIDNPKNIIPVNIPNNFTFNEHDRILVSFEKDTMVGEYVKTYNCSNSIKDNITIMLYNSGIPIEFSNSALEEIKKFPVSIDSELSDRTDYRDLTTVTIDGVRAKDLDDAVSLEWDDNSYTLYVHIADVSHYVKPGTNLFNEAYVRSTSIYPSNYVFPMLPSELSNGLCSLNPNVDRLTKTCVIKFDLDGNIIDTNIVKSVIRSNKKMNYDSVNIVLNNSFAKSEEKKVSVPEDYQEYEELLLKMNELSNKLQRKKINRGALCLETYELEFNLNDNEEISSINKRTRQDAELLIENFMLTTNEVIASYIYYLTTPFAFRNHEAPDISQLKQIKASLQSIRTGNFNNIKSVTKLIDKLKSESPFQAMHYSEQILKSMKRAYYSRESKGHYALALENYTHFTSPIRRFPDLINHYVIGEIINGRINMLEDTLQNIEEMCIHASEMQQKADFFEKHVDCVLLNKYADSLKDRVFEAKVVVVDRCFVGIMASNNLYGSAVMKKGEYLPGDIVKVKINSVGELSNQVQFDILEKVNKKVKKKGK